MPSAATEPPAAGEGGGTSSATTATAKATASARSAPPPPPPQRPPPVPSGPSADASAEINGASTTTAAATSSSSSSAAAAAKKVESSPQDERQYLSYTLPSNNLGCLLISDPTTEKGAAAIDVNVGHLSDPDDVKGLAHFCEHMLFLGTDRYPDENEYNKYLTSHGGSSNAFTDMEHTNYYFDVGAEHLGGALDRFAQFFISPLFTPSATTREMQAVDSEHSKNLQNDHWRLFQLYKSLCRPDHPFSKFGSGNLKTLNEEPQGKGLDVREALLDFHSRYYSSNVMKLVVLGKESLDELRDTVEGLFGDVADKGVDPPSFPGTPYLPAQLGRRVRIVPIREKREVELNFPLRETLTLYRKKPLKYLSHLIGHEGKGSILALLRERGWANELSAGESRQCTDWTSFSISIELTDDGLDRVDDVITVVFAYLNMLRNSGPQRWIYEEIDDVSNAQFRFLSKREPIDYVCALAGSMHLYPPEHTLSGPYKIWEYDPKLIEECMEALKPRNCLVAISAKKFEGETDRKEEWYGVEYSVEEVSEELLGRWEEVGVDDIANDDEGGGGEKEKEEPPLSFPERNDMIATDFELRKECTAAASTDYPEDEPRLLRDNPSLRLWYKPDNVFKMPKVNVMALLRTSRAYDSPPSAVLALLYVDILREHTTEFTYLATMAGLHCSFVNARKGIELHVSGYNHKADVLVKRIVAAMTELPAKLAREEFDRIKDKILKQYRNFLVGSQPYQHAFYGADLCLEMNKWSVHDKIAALEGLDVKHVVQFAADVVERFHLEMLVHGNVSPNEAEHISDLILDGLKPAAPFVSTYPQLRVVQLAHNRTYVHRFTEYNPHDPNSCLANVYQVGSNISLRTNAKISLLNHLLQEPAFNILRTQQQLGYIVHTSIKTTGDDVKGLLMLIMSDAYDPVHLDNRVESFLSSFRTQLVHMSDDEFESNVAAVVTNFLEKNKNLGEESSKYWNAVADGRYVFRRYQLIGEEVSKLKKADVLRFFDRYVAKGTGEGSCRSKLCVQVFSANHADATEVEEKNEGGVQGKEEKEGDVVPASLSTEKENEEEGNGGGDGAAAAAAVGGGGAGACKDEDAGVDEDEDEDGSVTVITEEDVPYFKRSMPLFPLPPKVDVEGMMMKMMAEEEERKEKEGETT